MNQWYALYTKLRPEKRVVVALQQHGIETFRPMLQSNSDGRKHEEVALFPGYLFVRANLEEENVAHVRCASGVHNVLVYGDRPVLLPDRIIDTLRREIGQREVVSQRARHPHRDIDVVRTRKVPLQRCWRFSGIRPSRSSP